MERGNRKRERHLILWDGDCGFCRRGIAWVLRRDHRGRLRALPYQNAPSPPMTPQLRAACARAVHVRTTDGQLLRGGRAALFVLQQIGYRRLARALAQKPFVWLVEFAYSIVARNRAFFSRFLFRG